jgi:hypothetical protein
MVVMARFYRGIYQPGPRLNTAGEAHLVTGGTLPEKQYLGVPPESVPPVPQPPLKWAQNSCSTNLYLVYSSWSSCAPTWSRCFRTFHLPGQPLLIAEPAVIPLLAHRDLEAVFLHTPIRLNPIHYICPVFVCKLL